MHLSNQSRLYLFASVLTLPLKPRREILRGVFLVHSLVEENQEASPPQPSTSAASSAFDGANIQLPTVADELASLVAVNGDQVEVMAREKNMDEPELS